MVTPPLVNRRVLENLLDAELTRHANGKRLVLVHGRYDSAGPAEFVAALAGKRWRVRVCDQDSVLGIAQAWQEFQAEGTGADDLLVVTTGVDDRRLGWDLRGHAIGHRTRTVDRADIVRQRFGAVDLDPRIRDKSWLLDGLLEAEPVTGWRRVGGVLTLDSAVRALVGARLGIEAGELDLATLLDWTRERGSDRFALLPDAERGGITESLVETLGGAAEVALKLVAAGRAIDVLPLGIVASAAATSHSTANGFALGRLLGDVNAGHIAPFAEAARRRLEAWLPDAHTHDQRRHDLLDVLRRADELAGEVGLTATLSDNRFLPSAFQARLRTLAAALQAERLDSSVDTALRAVREHAVGELYPDRAETAQMAVRLRRWLDTARPTVGSVADGVTRHCAEWGWVDRALAVLRPGDTLPDPVVGQAYRSIYEAALARRDALDEQFAGHLAAWTATASQRTPGGCLLVEDILDQLVRPLGRKPLVLVLDGMSSAVAVQLGEQLRRGGWIEVTPGERRCAAASAIPSVADVSRTSLLAGRPVAEGPAAGEAFAAFWRQHRRSAALFLGAEIGGAGGARLSEPIEQALADEDGHQVIAVVLDAVEHVRLGEDLVRALWRIEDVPHLRVLLDAALMYARPVVLVAGHGQLWERSGRGEAVTGRTEGAESVRWRTGVPGDGEVELAGPRVLRGGGRIVAPWREDIHYTPRRVGYHSGGASLAEMTAPALMAVPSLAQVPAGWAVLRAESLPPPWWEPGAAGRPAEPAMATRREEKPASAATEPLFPTPASLGTQVVSSEVYQAQRKFVRKAPDPAVVASVIDELAAADGTLPLATVAMQARHKRNPSGFAATLERLLNVEEYSVISPIDGGSRLRLDVELLREQFGVGP